MWQQSSSTLQWHQRNGCQRDDGDSAQQPVLLSTYRCHRSSRLQVRSATILRPFWCTRHRACSTSVPMVHRSCCRMCRHRTGPTCPRSWSTLCGSSGGSEVRCLQAASALCNSTTRPCSPVPRGSQRHQAWSLRVQLSHAWQTNPGHCWSQFLLPQGQNWEPAQQQLKHKAVAVGGSVDVHGGCSCT